jgi:hypothetical protein
VPEVLHAPWRPLSMLALLCAACAPRLAEPSAAPSGPVRQVPIGLCEDYPEERRSLEDVRRDFELLRRLGIDTLRVSFGWDGIEPERNRYDFEFWDEFVDLAVRDYRLTLIPYVAYTPAWNSDGGEADHWKTPPREPEEFAELMGLLAARYRGRIHSWELWNEPDNRDYWLGSVADYAELARLGAEAIRAVDPSIRIVSGGLAGTVEFLAQLFAGFDAARTFDVVNLHAYYETWNPAPLETLPRYVADVADLLRRHGGPPAIWMAEIGYGNYRRGRHVSAHTVATFAYEHTLQYQAVVLVKSLALLLSSPVSLVAWYELKDPDPSDAMIGDANNRHLGVAFADRRLKPAAAALAAMARRFAGGFEVVSDTLRVEVSGARRDAELRAFSTAQDELLIIAWLATPASSRGSERIPGPASETGDGVDPRQALLRVRGPYIARGPAVFHFASGEERAPSGARLESGAPLDLSIPLAGGEIQIVEIPIERD